MAALSPLFRCNCKGAQVSSSKTPALQILAASSMMSSIGIERSQVPLPNRKSELRAALCRLKENNLSMPQDTM